MRIFALTLLLIVLGGSSSSQVQGSATLEHERLRFRNDFKTPEEVVSYYCARDASGFVWSGLLDSERTAFTLWHDAPQQDSFLIASKYEVIPHKGAKSADQAVVDVRYDLIGIGDGHGTRMPPPKAEMKVTFNLKKVGGLWKIAKPDPAQLAPVVLESKFPSVVTR